MPSNFIPKRRLISDITVAERAIVTTFEDHGYSSGFEVRMWVPLDYGMNFFFIATTITVTSTTEFSTNLNTLFQSPFVAPTAPPGFTDAQVIPISGATDNIA